MLAKDVLLEEGQPGAQPKANSILALGKECQTLTIIFFFLHISPWRTRAMCHLPAHLPDNRQLSRTTPARSST